MPMATTAITLAELEAQFDTLFTRFDTNKDGALTRAELLTIKAMAVGERLGPAGQARRQTGGAMT